MNSTILWTIHIVDWMYKGECSNEKQLHSRSMKLCYVRRIGLVCKRQDEGILLGAMGGGIISSNYNNKITNYMYIMQHIITMAL